MLEVESFSVDGEDLHSTPGDVEDIGESFSESVGLLALRRNAGVARRKSDAAVDGKGVGPELLVAIDAGGEGKRVGFCDDYAELGRIVGRLSTPAWLK